MIQLRASPLHIPFKQKFKHASMDRAYGDSIVVELSDSEKNSAAFGEGCPRPYVTGESLEQGLQWIEKNKQTWQNSIFDLAALKREVTQNRHEINRHPGAWCAVELAYLDLFAQNESCSVESLLGISGETTAFQYTAVLGDDVEEKFAGALKKYLQFGFTDFKLKLSGNLERDLRKIEIFEELGDPKLLRLRFDANNFWKDDLQTCISHLKALLKRSSYSVIGVEEPLNPRDVEGLWKVHSATGLKIILDESFSRLEDAATYATQPLNTWIANLRISKCGGLLRTLECIHALEKIPIPVIVGAQVGETSLLTRAALVAVRALDKEVMLVAQEGAFGTLLLESDPAAPCLEFGAGGILNLAKYSLEQKGLGLTFNASVLSAENARFHSNTVSGA